MPTVTANVKRGLLVVLAMAFGLTGCTREPLVEPTPKTRTATPAALPTSTVPVPTAAPTPSATPESVQGLSLNPTSAREESAQDRFSLEVTSPHLEGASGTPADAFNREVEALIAGIVTAFRVSAREVAASGIPADQSSYLGIGYNVAGVVNGVLSVEIGVDMYAAGAAHPSHRTEVLNYELATGKVLGLPDLFRAGSNHLQVIADYCLQDLTRRDALVFEEGALPTAPAYQHWNLQPGGLLITFDEYQVAPYAAGPQRVLVPYSSLRDILDPAGPLAPFTR